MAVYVGVGWETARGWRDIPVLLHGVSAARLGVGLKPGVLFRAGFWLAWIVAVLWCR